MSTKNIVAMTAVVAMMALVGCSAQTNASVDAADSLISTPGENCTGGFESIWNSTPIDGNVSEMPQETVTVDSETGRVIEAMRRTADGTAELVAPESVDYKVTVDPSWPKNHTVMIDTATDKVLETMEIPVDAPLCE